MTRAGSVFSAVALAVLAAAGAPAAKLRGVFPLLITPYTEDARLDVPVLVQEAAFVAAHGADGVIWPPAADARDLDALGEYEAGLTALAARAAQADFGAVLTATCPGTNAVQALARVRFFGGLLASNRMTGAILARPPDDARTQEDLAAYYRALGKVAPCPVIIQTYNGKSPQPAIRLLVDLAAEYPAVYGYVKEESPGGRRVNNRIEKLVQAEPWIKTVFSGWGAKGLLYQGPQLGTRGIITQRPAYADLLKDIFTRIDAGADATDAGLVGAYGKYLLLCNLGDTFSTTDDEMRGPHLYALRKRGVPIRLISRKRAADGTLKAEAEFLTPEERQEIERRLAVSF